MDRVIKPEILDDLPTSDPEAQASRRDLVLLNRIMGHVRLWSRCLKAVIPKKGTDGSLKIVDLGAGDGSLWLRASDRMAGMGLKVKLRIVDRHPILDSGVLDAYRNRGWDVEVIEGDVFEHLRTDREGPADLMMCNLFLHHFQTEALKELFELASRRCRRFVAAEPRRAPLALMASRCLGLLGCNRVTRHDGPISIRAGFRTGELACLWPEGAWVKQDRSFGLFSQVFSAHREDVASGF